VVRVQSTEDAEEIVELARERGWIVIVGVEPDEMENLSDLHRLMRDEAAVEAKPRPAPKVSGNDYCRSRQEVREVLRRPCGKLTVPGAII
jgi:hypothetical protein